MFHDCHPHRRLRGIISGAALAGALLLSNPAGAHAAGIPGPAGVWRWIESLLADRMGGVTGDRAPTRLAVPAKEQVCPPTGCPKPQAPQAPQGPGIDPDGKP